MDQISQVSVAELISAFSSVSVLCQDMCRRFPNDQMVVLKGRAVAEKYTSDLRNPDSEGMVKKALKEYTQILLDVTFVEENQLVEDEFPATDGRPRMTKLMDLYATPMDLVKKVFGDFAMPMDVLGKDFVECLHWRKGALMYMYCNTLFEQKERVMADLSHYLQCLEEGVRHLESMLAVRLPASHPNIDSTVISDDTLALIKQGLFSDTHVLALMYAGEMCYWHQLLVRQKQQDNSGSRNSQPGVAMATRPSPNNANPSPNTLSPDTAGDVGSITRSASDLELSGEDVWQARHIGNRHSIHVCEGALLFDGKALGRTMLERYMKVVKGPLRFVGWDCARAEELLQMLNTQG